MSNINAPLLLCLKKKNIYKLINAIAHLQVIGVWGKKTNKVGQKNQQK